MAEAPFQDLIRRVRAGDEQAATELVRQYEPAVRRAVRFRLVDARLGRVLDSMDICQSVMASFFVRAALGQYELDKPEQLVKLLATMARNKLANQANREHAQRRDQRRIAVGQVQESDLPANGVTPSRQLAAEELLQETRRRLPPEERRLLELREQGLDWEAIAGQVEGRPEALRKKLARAVNRVAQSLGLEG
jgi:RNA polymerase sigma-70 factor (ECF subfamily)